MLLAADLGHYIGDSHMPLHVTRNYNGQYSGQSGVHSRYESNLIGTFQNQIIYDGDSLQYIENLPDYVFNMIYENYKYVDSVLHADSVAKAYAGNTTSTTYYNKFWEIAKNFTIDLFRKASYKLTCVIYTAWINAGGSSTGISENRENFLPGFNLLQNYPNPFNPTTKIKYSIPKSSNVVIKVFDINGKEIETIVNEEKPAGAFEITWNAVNLPSGVYFCQIKAGSFLQTRKMILLK